MAKRGAMGGHPMPGGGGPPGRLARRLGLVRTELRGLYGEYVLTPRIRLATLRDLRFPAWSASQDGAGFVRGTKSFLRLRFGLAFDMSTLTDSGIAGSHR
jgi:hypothetical protein